jgi:transcriptional regulator
MYIPDHFEETRVEVLHDLIRANPLGTLVTLTPTGLDANHIPFEIDPQPAPFGALRGHVARANPLWSEFSRNIEVLAVFQGPGEYVSPSWYPTRKETGRVVPTWNYAVVHARGWLRIVDDPAWLRAFVERLTNRHEAGLRDPWKVAEAPPDFIEQQIAAIVGLEIPLTRVIGKWKTSQNRSEQDRNGVAEALLEQGRDSAAAMAALVRQSKSK